jgi:regulator of replication initiation timing
MSDDLVKRLRNPVAAMRPTITDGRLAADRIEALTAQIAEDADARAQIDHRLHELVAQVDALTAENARLREALKEQIHIRQNCHLMPCAAPGNDSCECERMYRRALNTEEKTK